MANVNKEILNKQGNRILKISGNEILNKQGNRILKISGNDILKKGNRILKLNGNEILNKQGNRILKINGNEILNKQGNRILRLSGNEILNKQGNRIYKSSERLNNLELIAVLYQLGEIPGAEKSGGGSGKGGCFIATATMDDYDHPVVKELREFRDQYLLERDWGKKFTKYYYKFGPYPAQVISKSNLLKKVSYIFIVKPLTFVVRQIMNKAE